MLVSQSCLTLWHPMDYSLPGSSVHGLLQARMLECIAIPFSMGSSQFRDLLDPGIFPTQGLKPGLLHYRQVLYHLSTREALRILEWVAIPFSRGSSWLRDWTQVTCITGRLFTTWATRDILMGTKPQLLRKIMADTDTNYC